MQPLGDEQLGVRVDRAGRLDQHQDLGVGEQRAGQREPLALTAGEAAAGLVDRCVETLGQRVEDVLGAATSTAVIRSASPAVRSHGSSSSRSTPVNSRGSASDTSTRRRTVGERQVARAARPPRDDAVVVDQPAEPVRPAPPTRRGRRRRAR